MNVLALGLGGGLAAVVATSVMWFLLLRRSQGQADRATDRADKLAQRLDTQIEDNGELEKATAILTTNISELKRELGAKTTQVAELDARVTSVEKAKNNLVDILSQHPGAIAPVVTSAFDELRQALSRAQAAPAPGDPSGGEADLVHGDAAGETPR